MQPHQKLTPQQKAKIKKEEDCRRRKGQQREDETRRRIASLRRQIEAARRRRQYMLLLILLAVLAIWESFLKAFRRSLTYQPSPHPEPENWIPDPARDYAPKPGNGDYIDGYSYAQWSRMSAERGIQMSRKAELKAKWMADPERKDFPPRYKDWGYRPYLGEIMNDLHEPSHQLNALKGIKLLSPPETHQYLEEVYAINPLNLLHCRADTSADIVRNFQSRAVLWEEQKKRDAEEARKNKKTDDDEKNLSAENSLLTKF